MQPFLIQNFSTICSVEQNNIFVRYAWSVTGNLEDFSFSNKKQKIVNDTETGTIFMQ